MFCRTFDIFLRDGKSGSSPSSADVAAARNFYLTTGGVNRHGSLAYSSSGEMTQADLNAWTTPRDSIELIPALAAAAGAAASSGGGEAGPERSRLVPGGALFLSGSRGLKPNEVQALEQVRKGVG